MFGSADGCEDMQERGVDWKDVNPDSRVPDLQYVRCSQRFGY